MAKKLFPIANKDTMNDYSGEINWKNLPKSDKSGMPHENTVRRKSYRIKRPKS